MAEVLALVSPIDDALHRAARPRSGRPDFRRATAGLGDRMVQLEPLMECRLTL